MLGIHEIQVQSMILTGITTTANCNPGNTGIVQLERITVHLVFKEMT